MTERNAESPDGCEACLLQPDRREFLQHAKLIALGALLGLGVPRGRAFAMRPARITPRAWLGNKPTYPIPSEDGVQIDNENEVILARWDNTLYAFSLLCTHRNTAIEWHEGDSEFECPRHNSKFAPDGTLTSGRAPRSLDRFSMTRSGDNVTVDTDAIHKDDEDHDAWLAAVLVLDGTSGGAKEKAEAPKEEKKSADAPNP